jgi:hypothetical protein
MKGNLPPLPTTVDGIVAEMRADLEALGGFERGLLGVPAVAVREYIFALESAIAADRAKLGEAVPEGWQLVPTEPTPEMLQAAHDVFGNPLGVLCYRAMLAAAPKEPT